MNDEVNQEITDEALGQVDELSLLKQRAALLGIKHSPNIGVDALKAKITEAMTAEKTTRDETKAVGPVSEAARKARLRKQIRDEELKLIRVRITNMNPSKKDLHGEIFTVANKYTGTVKKFIPYGEATDDGYHIPNIIFKALKARKFNSTRTRRNKQTGEIILEQRWVPEFSLEVMPQLNEEELKQLAASQAAAKGM